VAHNKPDPKDQQLCCHGQRCPHAPCIILTIVRETTHRSLDAIAWTDDSNLDFASPRGLHRASFADQLSLQPSRQLLTSEQARLRCDRHSCQGGAHTRHTINFQFSTHESERMHLVWVVALALGSVVSDEAKMLPLVDATPRDPIGPWAWDTIPYFVHCSNATGTHATHVQFVRHTTHTLSFGLVLTSSISRQWAKCSNTAGTVPASILPSCRRIRRVLAARCGGGVVGVFAEMTARARLSHNLVTRTNDACTATGSRSQCAFTLRHTRYHATARDHSHQSSPLNETIFAFYCGAHGTSSDMLSLDSHVGFTPIQVHSTRRWWRTWRTLDSPCFKQSSASTVPRIALALRPR
jgi:hypothetical protein